VVKGYEQIPGVDYTESFAPVACDAAIHTLIALSLYQQQDNPEWVTEVIDVETAFLNADLQEEVYIKIPNGLAEYTGKKFDTNDVLKLNKALRGLVQAPRAWMMTFADILKHGDSLSARVTRACLPR
jgi:hypothetical protein